MLGNWIKETTTTTGTGSITLAGAASGFATFDSQFPNATLRYFNYIIESGTSRELGIGHLTSSTTLVRDNVLATLVSGTYTRYTGAGTPITLAGTSDVYCDISANWGMCPGIVNGATQGVPPIQITGQSNTTGTRDGGFQWMWPFSLPVSGNYTGVRININATASAALKVGLYDVGNDGRPDRLIANRATGLTLATGAQDVSFDSAIFLQAHKFYYLGFLSDNTPTYVTTAAYNIQGGGPLGAASSTVYPTNAAFITRSYASGMLSPFSGSPTYEAGRSLPFVSFLRTA